MATMTTAAGTSVPPNPHAAHLHLLIMLFVAPAAAFFAASPATSPMLATPVPATWRQEPSNFIFPTASSSWSSTILLSQQHQSSSDNDVSSSGGFESLGLSDDLITVTQSMNWDSPTPVQQLSIPAILNMATHQHNHESNNDDIYNTSNSLWCESPTGSGKTGSFALPLLQLMLLQQQQKQAKKLGSRKQQRRRLGRISTLILCPTRELAAQTGDVFHRLASHLPSSNSDNTDINISIDVVHGGVSTEMQMTRFVEQYNSGVDIDILVATPGRLLDILRNNKNAESSLERRIMDALDGKSMNNNNGRSGRGTKGRRMDARGRGGPGGGRGPRISAASLSLNDIQEMMNDDATVGEERGGSSTIREMFRGLQYLVLDEADRLLGKAFQDEMDELLSLLPISTSSRSDEVNNNSRRQLKTLLFSATFPEQIEARVDRVLSLLSGGVGRPLRVSTTTASGAAVLLPRALSSSASSDRITEAAEDESDSDHLINSSSGDDDDDSEQQLLSTRKHSNTNITPIQNTMPDSGPNIRHRAIRLNEGDRTQALRSLLEQRHADGGGGGGGGADESDDKASDEWNRVLVFVATRYSTEHVSQKLRRLGISASELHGKLDQEARDQRLKQFRSGKTRVLCATDLAARGIDVHGIDLVVNYDLPKSVADYTHRTGRTGRAGSSGTAISFISGKSESHFDFLEKGISSADHKHNGIQRQKIEREVLPNFTPDEAVWKRESAVATISLPGAMHSEKGLEHDRTFGGVKGRRKSKKDKLREAAAAVAAAAASDA